MSLVNIASHLPEMARRQPDTPAVILPTGRASSGEITFAQFTFRELNERSDRIAMGLEGIGIKRGVRTVLMVTPSLDFFALTFALFKAGAVPVFVDPGMGVKNLGKCLAEAEPEAFIGIPKAHVARVLLGWGKPTVKRLVTVGPRLFWGGVTLKRICDSVESGGDYHPAETSAEDMAAILFTSGSTGIPKGVVYTHGTFADQVEKIRRIYYIQPGEIDLPTFPLFALFAPALGMTAVIPQMDFTRPGSVDPGNIIDSIKQFKVTTMFGSPALVNRVGRFGEANGVKLPTLKRVISAGAPVPPVVLERFCKMLSNDAEIVTPYGATECLPVASIGSKEILGDTQHDTARGKGVCVGMPLDDLEVRIIRITDDPIAEWSDDLVLPDGEIGEITVKGGNTTREYFNRESSTRLAKIADSSDGGFWHRMGDVGYMDEKGRLWMCGRKSHRVIVGAETLFTIPCEAIFNAHKMVFRTALVGVNVGGEIRPMLCVELEPGTGANQAQVREELLHLGAEHELTRNIKTILFHPKFPVDIRHNAKIFREKLAVWAEGRQ